jgi:isfu1 transposase
VDEIGANTSLSVIRAWSRTGKRAGCTVLRNRGKITTLLASMGASGMGSTLAVEGATDREVYRGLHRRSTGPSAGSGQIVVVDNLTAYKEDGVRKLIEERGCELLYLPPIPLI